MVDAMGEVAVPETGIDLAAIESAEAAGLRYVTDQQPGMRREKKRGASATNSFLYRDAKGELIRDEATLACIRALVIPPAWTDVWICALPRGHLQATGKDARGRKQYRYQAIRNSILLFSRAWPIRHRANKSVRGALAQP